MPRALEIGGLVLLLSTAACGASTTQDCPAGETRCGGACVDLQTSPVSCGACFRACAAGASCVDGQCQCPAGQEVCAGACVDPATYATDPLNCGACAVACGIGTCAGGVCQCEGATFCPGLSPLCRDLQNDAESCNTCGRICPLLNDVCVGGSCVCPPTAPTPCPTAAPTRCVNTQTDAANCGACGIDCPLSNDVCVDGSCACPASAPLECPAADPTRCVDPDTDEEHCGGCDNPCATGATCTTGTCSCPTGQTVCGTGASARCVNLQTDARNCGTCGRVCPSGATCTSSDCQCPVGQPVTCGTATRTCCAGDGCCNGSCQTVHSNGIGVLGLGQSYFDCNPLGTYTAAAAARAAQAWNPAPTAQYGGFQVGCSTNDCLGWQTAGGCAVWCYGNDALRGRVSLNTASIACLCPAAGPPNWN